jgi:hypothetical protein
MNLTGFNKFFLFNLYPTFLLKKKLGGPRAQASCNEEPKSVDEPRLILIS